jgi:hypothetical protein
MLVGGTTLVLVVALGVRPVSGERIVAAYVLALAAIAIAALVRALAGGPPHASPFEAALSSAPESPGRPPELIRIERELTLGTSSAGHLHNRLVPLLREAAAARLGRELTRERVGDEAWELVRPDRQEPDDRNAPGISLRRVRAVIAALERL